MLQQLPAKGLKGHASGCGQAAQWPVLAAGMSKALFPQRTACTACSTGVWQNPQAGICRVLLTRGVSQGLHPFSPCPWHHLMQGKGSVQSFI